MNHQDSNRHLLRPALALAVAALLSANGAVAAERLSHKDLRQLVADWLRPAGEDLEVSAAGERGPMVAQGQPDDDVVPSPAADGGQISAGHAPGGTGAPVAAGEEGSGGGSNPVPRPRRGQPSTSTTRGAGPSPNGGTAGTAGTVGVVTATPPPGAGLISGAAPTTSSTAGTSTTPTTAVAQTGPSPAMRKAVAEVGAWVQAKRGFKFTGDVGVRVMDADEFNRRLAGLRPVPSAQELAPTEKLLKLLGAVDEGVNLRGELLRLAAVPTTAIYDPGVGEILTAQREPTPMLRTDLAREFTFALDGQRFGVGPAGIPATLDPVRDGKQTLRVGTAEVISAIYVADLPSAEKSAVEAEQRRRAEPLARVPASVSSLFELPRLAGKALVAALVRAGGSARINQAHAAPPDTVEQIVDPDRYLAGEGARPVPAPAADGPATGQGTIGQLALGFMLSAVDDGVSAAAASSGWGGDRYVVWQNATRTCVRASFVTDSPADDDELAAALARWAAARPGAQVDPASRLTITRCR